MSIIVRYCLVLYVHTVVKVCGDVKQMHSHASTVSFSMMRNHEKKSGSGERRATQHTWTEAVHTSLFSDASRDFCFESFRQVRMGNNRSTENRTTTSTAGNVRTKRSPVTPPTAHNEEQKKTYPSIPPFAYGMRVLVHPRAKDPATNEDQEERIPVATLQTKIPPEILEYLLQTVPFFACEEKDLVSKHAFRQNVDHPDVPGHRYYEGYFHASAETSEPILSVHPRLGSDYLKPAAPSSLRALMECIRRGNSHWLKNVFLQALSSTSSASNSTSNSATSQTSSRTTTSAHAASSISSTASPAPAAASSSNSSSSSTSLSPSSSAPDEHGGTGSNSGNAAVYRIRVPPRRNCRGETLSAEAEIDICRDPEEGLVRFLRRTFERGWHFADLSVQVPVRERWVVEATCTCRTPSGNVKR